MRLANRIGARKAPEFSAFVWRAGREHQPLRAAGFGRAGAAVHQPATAVVDFTALITAQGKVASCCVAELIGTAFVAIETIRLTLTSDLRFGIERTS